MSLKGADRMLATIAEWQVAIKNMNSQPKAVMVNSTRIASSKTQVEERGSIKDRLGKTDAEAEMLGKVEDVRLGRTSSEDPSQSNDIDDAVIDRLIDDIIEKTILKGL